MDTVYNISESQMSSVLEDIDGLHTNMLVALLSTICLAIHTVCAAYAAKTQFGRGLKGSRRNLLLATAAMYISTAVSWIALLLGQFQSLDQIKGDLLYEFPSGYVWPVLESYVGSTALAINVLIGDSIVWWRVWVLWNKSRPILITSSCVILLTLCLGVGSFFITSVVFFTGPIGLALVALSLFSNTVSTLLVGYKGWKHRKNSKSLHLASVSSVNQVQRALMLLFESGIVYCVLWVLVLSSEAWTDAWQQYSDSGSYWLWTNIMQYVVQGCLVAFVGIYPTLIITVIALDKSKIEQECKSSTMPSVGFTPPLRPPIQVAIATHMSETVEEDGRRHTVVMIGLPSSGDSDGASDLAGKNVSEGDTGMGV